VPRLIPPPGEPITLAQAELIVGHHADDAGELAAGVAARLRDAGRIVHFWKVFTADELVKSWNVPSDVVMIALVHYAPSSSIPFDAVQIRLDRSTGELHVWDGRGVPASTVEPS
jgi:hypothetical protein